MKKIKLLFMFLSMAYLSIAQNYTEIKGYIKMNKELEEVSLFDVRDGQTHLYATTKVAKDGSFGFSFVPERIGFYTIGSENINHVIFIKGGEDIYINLLDTKAELFGKNTKENIQLYKWEKLADSIRLKSVYFMLTRSTYEDFFPEFTVFLKQAEDFKAEIKKIDPQFDALFKRKIDYDLDYYALKFVRTPRMKHPGKNQLIDYYRTIVSKDKFLKDDVLELPYGVSLVRLYVYYAVKEHKLDQYLAFLPNDRLKGECVLWQASRYKTYDDYLNMADKYGKYFTTASLKARAEAVGTKLYKSVSGNIAADFSYPDLNGKMISLSDFKGKVVLVDVWATWCAPCRKEIPALKELEKEFHGKDLVVIGVSVDEEKDKEKWMKFVEKEQLGGIQLFASGWSKITKDYQITGIPRFLVFNKKGNVVSIKAPRPSNPELKKLLYDELEKSIK